MDTSYNPYNNLSVFHPQAGISSEVLVLGWNIALDELKYIPDHWLSYPAANVSLHYMLGIIYIFLMIASLIGNGLVIWIFSSAKSLRTPSNIFVVNLAILDFIMFAKIPMFIYNSFRNGTPLSRVQCQLFAIIGSISGIGAGMTNAFIAYDRYNVITKPMEGKMTTTKAVIVVAFIWIYNIPWTLLPYLEIWGRFVPASEIRLLGWNVRPEDLRHIPDHWLSYPEPPASLHYLFALLYIFLTVVALIGNGLVIWVFCGAKSLRTPSNIFVINLAICDFLMMCKTPIFIYNSFGRGFVLGHIGCQVFAFIGSLSGIGAGMTNAFIAFDRYNVITRPMERTLTITKATLMIAIVWLYTIPWATLPLTEFWGRYVPEGYLTSCTFDYMTDDFDTRLFVGCIFFCSYLVPMTMIIIYYSQIVSHVFAHEKQLREQAKKMNVESLRSNAGQSKETAEIRIAKAAITICFLFVAAWTPYGVMALIGAFGDKNLLTPGVTMIPACCCKLVACIDPYVYAISHPRYRMELQKRLPWLAIDEKETSDATSASTATEPATTTG